MVERCCLVRPGLGRPKRRRPLAQRQAGGLNAMKTNWACIAGLLLAACSSAPAQTPAARSVPCDTGSVPKGWRTYVDRTHGFCFRYPPIYKRVPNEVHKEWLPTFHLVTFQRLHSDAHIFVSMNAKPSYFQSFFQPPPPAILSPPAPIHISPLT